MMTTEPHLSEGLTTIEVSFARLVMAARCLEVRLFQYVVSLDSRVLRVPLRNSSMNLTRPAERPSTTSSGYQSGFFDAQFSLQRSSSGFASSGVVSSSSL